MDFERDTLEAVIKARNQAIAVPHSGPENMKQIGAAEAALGGALSRLAVQRRIVVRLREPLRELGSEAAALRRTHADRARHAIAADGDAFVRPIWREI